MKKLIVIFPFLFPSILIAVAIFISLRTYTAGTWLVGWDSLHPEFDFQLYFSRLFSGVWRGEQGVGAIAAHAHMSELPRVFLLWVLSLVAPGSSLRYLYVFMCLIFGPLGVYFFLKYGFQVKKTNGWAYPAAFSGALFYLLNLGTLQHFYVPFEMFPTAFAFLPWLFFTGFKYLREGGSKNLVFFALVVIFAAPMAYASLLAIVSFAGLFIFLLAFVLVSPGKKKTVGRFFVVLVVAVSLNLYWILPNTYSLVNQSRDISQAQTNMLFSPEAFLRNQQYGGYDDVLIQKNFLFEWRNFDFDSGQFKDLLGDWSIHLSDSLVVEVGRSLAILAVAGVFLGILLGEKVILALIPVVVFALFFLFNANPPLGGIYSYLYNNFEVFREAMRMPFTKFSILFEVLISYFFGYFLFVLFGAGSFGARFMKMFRSVFNVLALFVVVAGLVFFMMPVFNGGLIGPNVRVQLPNEYNSLFTWFKSNSYGRVAVFPMPSKFGWEYRNWGYEGSGFITYGIENPTFYRDFDRWSPYNEDFFEQVSHALYSKDLATFENTLKKYQVKYLLLDESVINPGGSQDLLYNAEFKDIVEESPNLKEVASFGFLKVYETNFDVGKTYVSAPENYIEINADMKYTRVDPLYGLYGDYVEVVGNTATSFPFANMGNRGPVDTDIRDDHKASNSAEIVFTNTMTGDAVLAKNVPAIKEDLSLNRGFADAYNCDIKKLGSVYKENSSKGILYTAENGGVSCDYLNFSDLSYDQAYVLRIAGENRDGRSLKFYLTNYKTGRADLEELLPGGEFDQTYFVYPSAVGESGYSLNFETRSFGKVRSENLLTRVEFYPVDYEYLHTFNGFKDVGLRQNNIRILDVKKYGNWAYRVDIEGDGLIQLGQGYEQGWKAVPTWNFQFPNFKRELNHTKINSWANGWFVPAQVDSSPFTLYLVYWPQILQWGGMIIALVTLVVVVKKKSLKLDTP